jgi:tetratricopeptide (TPR) repeat protein
MLGLIGAKPMGVALLICAAVIAVYSNSFAVPFVFDDVPSTVENPTIHQLWPPWAALSPPHGRGLTVEGRPILNFSLAVNYAISGDNPWSYHLANVAIHVLAALTLFGIVRRTLARREARAVATLLAFVVALLWAVHPLQTESVTYVIQRAEALMGLFYLLTLYCFIRYSGDEADGPRALNAANSSGHGFFAGLSVLACFLGMATKEVMVSAPVIVVLYDRTFVSGSFRAAWRLRWRYYGALGLAALVLVLLALRTGTRGGTAGFGIDVSPWKYAKTQFQAISHYLWLSVWPHPLIFDYGVRWTERLSDYLAYALFIGALVVGSLGALFWPAKEPAAGPLKGPESKGPLLTRPGRDAGSASDRSERRFGTRALGFLGIWVFAILAPTSSIVPGNRQTLAEHRMYLPLAAVIVLIVCGGWSFLRKRGGYAQGRAWILILLGAAAGLGAASYRRNRDYRSVLILYRDTVAKRPENAFAHYNLGKLLDESGSQAEAVSEYRAALKYAPDMVQALYNLGNTLDNLGRPAEAVEQYRAALRVDPNYAKARYNLGNAYIKLGRKEEAREQFNDATLLKPDYVEARDNLGGVLLDLGRFPEAEAQFREVLRTNPNLFETHFNLGNALLLQGRGEEAALQFEEVLRIKPDFAPARQRLDALRGRIGR